MKNGVGKRSSKRSVLSNAPRPSTASVTLVALEKWTRDIGRTPSTVWRWRKAGWLKTMNIAGRQYVSSSAIEEFQRRAEAGEFAKDHKVPA